MKNSSAKQLELDYSFASPDAQSVVSGHVSRPSVSATEANEFPDFSKYGEAYAATARMAGRINAAVVSPRELDELLRERKRLINKKLDGTISRKESNRLEYVRWSLDRIEDARDGHILEALEHSVVRYEKLASDLAQLYETLGEKLPKKKK